MATNAVAVIGDLDYIVPSAATALSARRNLARPDIGVVLFVVVPSEGDRLSGVADQLAGEGITLRPVMIDDLRALAAFHHDEAVPVSALSRLWLHEFLDEDVARFLYLDGDILVDAPLDPLFDLEIPEGGFLASDDCLCLYENEIRQPRRHWEPYLRSIEVAWRDYFNSGVLLVDRAGWAGISAEALRYLVDKSALCRASDQTALNAVAGPRRGRLPLRWNYQTEHMMVLDPRAVGVQPAIWHFAASPKPWDLPDWPWDESFNRAFRDAQALLHGLDLPAPPVNRVKFDEGVRHRRRQRNLQRWRFLLRRYLRSRRIQAAL